MKNLKLKWKLFRSKWLKQMVEAKKNERTDALKKVKEFFKEFDFTDGMLKGEFIEARKAKK